MGTIAVDNGPKKEKFDFDGFGSKKGIIIEVLLIYGIR